MISRRKPIYEDHAKAIFHGPEGHTLVQHFKDGVKGFEHDEVHNVEGKGVLNNRISERLMYNLALAGVPTHFIRRLNMREQLVGNCESFPFSVRVYNVACDDFHTRFDLEKNQPLARAVLEYALSRSRKDQGDLVSEEHITAFNWAAAHEVEEIFHLSLRINDLLSGMCLAVGLRLMRVELNFARATDEEMARVVLGGELTPDKCRFQNRHNNHELASLVGDGEAGGEDMRWLYQEIARRFGVLEEPDNEDESMARADARPPVTGARIYSFAHRAKNLTTSSPPRTPGAPSGQKS
ncbi:MAG: phosphoribosylaminoimidazolesuccinocarboxamide synthase [Alphaproteobacteria bacterium]